MYQNQAKITLVGPYNAAAANDSSIKSISVYGTLELHGPSPGVTWTHLAQTLYPVKKIIIFFPPYLSFLSRTVYFSIIFLLSISHIIPFFFSLSLLFFPLLLPFPFQCNYHGAFCTGTMFFILHHSLSPFPSLTLYYLLGK